MLQLDHYPVGIRMLALSVYGRVHPRLFDHLLRTFGSLDEIFFAEASDLARVDGLSPEQQSLIEAVGTHLDQAAQLAQVLSVQGIEMVNRYDDLFRPTLFELNDPPLLLYVRGNLPAKECPALGLIGPRHGSQAGMALAADTVRLLGTQNLTLVSSLRGGLDAAVLLTARNVGKSIIAVTDGGIDEPLGDEAQLLLTAILTDLVDSAIVTEQLKSESNNAAPHEAANRLIAGLSDGIAITECHAGDIEVLDLIAYCEQIGKICFLLTDDNSPDLIDTSIRLLAIKSGAIPISVRKELSDLVRVLV